LFQGDYFLWLFETIYTGEILLFIEIVLSALSAILFWQYKLIIMKKIIISMILFSAVLCLAGCLTTLHPIFTAKDLMIDSRLFGNWEKAKDKTKVIYRQPNAYEVTNLSPALQNQATKIYMLDEKDAQGNMRSTYYAFMIKLGKYYYMDYYPASEKERRSADNFFAAHYIPMHSIYRIEFKSNNSFNVQRLDGGYLEKLIKNKQIRIKHEVMEDGGILITASTEELQQYLIKYSEVPEAYNNDNDDNYTRIK
jgi:hypothetical protein